MADIYEIISLADSVAETLAQLREEDRVSWLDEYAREADTLADTVVSGRIDWRYLTGVDDPEPLAPQVLAVLQLTGRFVSELQASSGARRKLATVRPEQFRALSGAVRDAIQNPRPPAPATSAQQAPTAGLAGDTGPVTGTSTPTTTTSSIPSSTSTVPEGPSTGTPPAGSPPTTMPSSTTTSTGTAASSPTTTAASTTTSAPTTSTTTTTSPTTSTTVPSPTPSTTVPAATSTTVPGAGSPGSTPTRESAFPTDGAPSGAATDPATAGSADTNEAAQRVSQRKAIAWVYEALGHDVSNTALVSPDPLLMETWNTYNPDEQVGSFEELYGKLANRWDPMVQQVVGAVGAGEDAAIDLRIALPGGRSQLVTASQYANARNYVHGGAFTTAELTTIVRWADMAGLRDSTGQVAWQPAMAVLLAHGVRDPKPSDIRQVEISDGGSFESRRVAGESDYVRQFKPQQVRTALKPLIAFREGLRQYGGNSGYAFLHSVDPQLALKLSTSSPDKWARADIVKANQWLIRGGVVNEDTNLGRAGYATEGDVVLDQSVYSGNRNTGPSGAVRSVPDPVAVRQAAKDMWKQFFVSDPSDEQVAQLAAQISSAISSAPMNQSVDVEARVREMLLNNGLYKELYSRMPKGMTEGEYQNQFRQAAQTMLGAQAADPSVIRAGMRTGSYQTSIGAAASSKAAFDNSTFMGRLAAAAQVVSENT